MNDVTNQRRANSCSQYTAQHRHRLQGYDRFDYQARLPADSRATEPGRRSRALGRVAEPGREARRGFRLFPFP
ncbi:hypothetical protein U1Q18_010785 [Sarracenia purpurea var. burkii]